MRVTATDPGSNEASCIVRITVIPINEDTPTCANVSRASKSTYKTIAYQQV